MGNKQSPFVLRALCILGPEEILKLAHVLNREEASFKKAAGDDVVVWKQNRPAVSSAPAEPRSEAKILNFSRPAPMVENKKDTPPQEDTESQIMSSDVVLLQREVARENGANGHKAEAQKGYLRATEMYVVKTPTIDGKDKIRFASTNGVLVNKKQA